jgi:hypothetical protein
LDKTPQKNGQELKKKEKQNQLQVATTRKNRKLTNLCAFGTLSRVLLKVS